MCAVKSDDNEAVEDIGMFKKVLNSITIEPFLICWLLPFAFTIGKF